MNHESYSQPPDLSPAQAASLRSPEPLCLNCGMERTAHGRFESCDGRETHWQAAPRLLFTSGSWLHDPQKPAPEPVPYSDEKKVKKVWALPVNPPKEPALRRGHPSPQKMGNVTVEAILDRRAKGMSSEQIASELGCSRSLVCLRLRVAGKTAVYVRDPAIDAAAVTELWKSGKSMREIGEQFGVSWQIIWRRVRTLRAKDPALSAEHKLARTCKCSRPKRANANECGACVQRRKDRIKV